MKLNSFSSNISAYLWSYSHKVMYLSVYHHYFIFYDVLHMFYRQNSGDNSIFLKMLKDFDDYMQNKTCKCIKMTVFACLDSLPSDSISFWFKICEEKNFTIASCFAIIEHESHHYCETLL